jgi:putative transposase
MSEKYKVRDQERPYFVTFATESWVDVFTRQIYKDIIVESIKYCQTEKGLVLYAWCLMTNHIHLIVGRGKDDKIEEIIRDFKKYTSAQICKAIEKNNVERSGCWLFFVLRAKIVKSTVNINFGKMNIIP